MRTRQEAQGPSTPTAFRQRIGAERVWEGWLSERLPASADGASADIGGSRLWHKRAGRVCRHVPGAPHTDQTSAVLLLSLALSFPGIDSLSIVFFAGCTYSEILM